MAGCRVGDLADRGETVGPCSRRRHGPVPVDEIEPEIVGAERLAEGGGVVAIATIKRVVAGTSIEGVVAGHAFENVVARIAGDDVVKVVAGAVDGGAVVGSRLDVVEVEALVRLA